MRNKIAKALRAKARVSGVAEQTTYTMEVFNKTYFDPLTGKLKGYKVYTASMQVCELSVYRELKKNFKSKV
ncbi:MAG: hypothetical protein ACRC6V_01980 [Bacteroidales bacterium]